MSEHPILTFVALFVIGITITGADISAWLKTAVELVTALGVIYGVYVASRAAKTVKETSKTVIETQARIDATTESTLHQVNSATTKLQTTNDALMDKIALLEKTAAENKEIAAKLAASVELAAAYATVPHTAPAVVAGATAEASLKSIDKSATAIDANTKKTTEDVRELKDKS